MSRLAPILLLFAASCGKPDAGKPRKPEAMAQLLDRTKPLLNDARVTGLVSVAKDHPDLRHVFLSKDAAATPKEGLKQLDQRDADAAKYGFADYYEFAEVRARVGTAQAGVKAAELLDPKIKELEAKVAQPGLSDGQRKIYQEGLTTMQRNRDSYLKQLPAEDMEAYRRNRAAVDAVLK